MIFDMYSTCSLAVEDTGIFSICTTRRSLSSNNFCAFFLCLSISSCVRCKEDKACFNRFCRIEVWPSNSTTNLFKSVISFCDFTYLVSRSLITDDEESSTSE